MNKIISDEFLIEKIWNMLQRISGLAGTITDYNLQQSIVNEVQKIANVGVKPIASIFLTLFAILELHKFVTTAEKNGLAQGSSVRIELLIVLLFKIVIMATFIQNVDKILIAIVEVGNELMNSVAGGGGANLELGIGLPQLTEMVESQNLNFLEKLAIFTDLIVPNLLSYICLIIVFIVSNIRLVSIYVYLALAPIPFVTLIHEEQSQIGKNFIKSFSAVVLQGAVMVVVVMVYSILIQSPLLENGNVSGIIYSSIKYALLLVISLIGSGKLAKKLLNAT